MKKLPIYLITLFILMLMITGVTLIMASLGIHVIFCLIVGCLIGGILGPKIEESLDKWI